MTSLSTFVSVTGGHSTPIIAHTHAANYTLKQDPDNAIL